MLCSVALSVSLWARRRWQRWECQQRVHCRWSQLAMEYYATSSTMAMHGLNQVRADAARLVNYNSGLTQMLTYVGAVVCRVAPSMLRFGSLELPFSRNEMDVLKQIVEYVIAYHYPEFADLAWVSCQSH